MFAILFANMRRRDLTEAPFESRLESDKALSPRRRTVVTLRSVMLIDGSSKIVCEGSHSARESARSSTGSANDVRESRETLLVRESREPRELREVCDATESSSCEPRRKPLSAVSCEDPRRRPPFEDPYCRPSVCESRRDSYARRSSDDQWPEPCCELRPEWSCESSCADPRQELTEPRREPRMPIVCWKMLRRAGPELERCFFSGVRLPGIGVEVAVEYIGPSVLSAR